MIDPSGNFLLAANQDSDNIVVFKRDKITGLLKSTKQEIKIPAPVCLKMIGSNQGTVIEEFNKKTTMKNKDIKTDPLSGAKGKENNEEEFPGYPIYPASEDIMNQEEEEDIDVEKITGSARINNEIAREKGGVDAADFDESLDIPGAELDDDGEAIGEEDEENNFYSLGGDRHEGLEEDNDSLD